MTNSTEQPMPLTGEVYADNNVDKGICGLGLTKREHFALVAMQGLIARQRQTDDNNIIAADLAFDAVMLAEALLKELDEECNVVV
jgi:hypothetical protein